MAVNVNTGRRSARRLGARALAISVLSFLVAVGGPGITVSSASGLRPDGQSTTLTIMTSPVVWLGMTKKSSGGSNSIAAWYTYYHSIWAKDFPNVTIKEIEVPDDTTMVTKTLLGVESGNPPDLVAMHEQLPGLVERGAL
jgi:ABC-type glycerol-3-phosphate transport system substrate-binding protein